MSHVQQGPTPDASAAVRGLMGLGAQTFAGVKTFQDGISAPEITALQAGQHAAVTLGAVGSAPNANGASLAGQLLTLQPADAANPGVVTGGAQTWAGVKTFNAQPSAPSYKATAAAGPAFEAAVGGGNYLLKMTGAGWGIWTNAGNGQMLFDVGAGTTALTLTTASAAFGVPISAPIISGTANFSGATVQISAGAHIYWSSGSANPGAGLTTNASAATTGATPATSAFKFYPQNVLDAADWLLCLGNALNAAGVFVVTYGGKALASGGIGVGNSAAASALGTVTKKMEVFDAAGASLGFVPIYDAIT